MDIQGSTSRLHEWNRSFLLIMESPRGVAFALRQIHCFSGQISAEAEDIRSFFWVCDGLCY
jgi:hypothetical protein